MGFDSENTPCTHRIDSSWRLRFSHRGMEPRDVRIRVQAGDVAGTLGPTVECAHDSMRAPTYHAR